MSVQDQPADGAAGRVRWVEHLGVRILCVDLSGIEDPGKLRATAERGYEAVRHQPPDSLLMLTHLAGVPYTLENVHILRDVAARNSPFIRARAVVGLPAVAHLALRPFTRLSGRPLQTFGSADEAKDWLAEQARS